MNHLKRILVPHDYGETSAAAADYAIMLARVFGAGVWFLHVGEPPAFNDYLGSELELDGVAADEVRERVKGACSGSADGLTHLRYFARSGSPATEITRFADQNAVDLIVMGTHGRSGVAHMLLGSVAETVVRTAPCPVLTVRGPVPVVEAADGMPAYAVRTSQIPG
jgi:nucleotide-binding universal stress UspA family protein